MKAPLVSVITPTFHERWDVLTERCIPSVNNQTYAFPYRGERPYSLRLEHVIVSDGPFEQAEEDLHECGWREIGSRFTGTYIDRRFVALGRDTTAWFSNPCPAVMPLAVGALLARGDYICPLNDDDELAPTYVEEMLALLERTGADFACCQQRVIDDSGRIPERLTPSTDRAFPFHKVELLKIANRRLGGKPGAPWEDRDLIDHWERGGAVGAWLDKPLLIHHEDHRRTGGHANGAYLGEIELPKELSVGT